MSSPWLFAVDLGTTNTVAAWADGSAEPHVLSLNGNTIHPSGVFLTADGVWLTGASARNALHVDPARFEPTPKRRVPDQQMALGGRLVPVVELLAAVLRPLLAEASRQHGGTAPVRLILTHPASWSPARVELLRAAAFAATPEGQVWPGADAVPEPVAAAWHAGTSTVLPNTARLAVFDVGGGTLDVAVVDRVLKGSTYVYSVVGQPDALDPLGGEDFDLWLAGLLAADAGAPGAMQRLQGSADPTDRLTFLDLRRSARDAKEALSSAPAVPAHVPALPPDLPAASTVQVQRRSFEALVRGDERRPGLRQGVELLRRVIDSAPLGPPFAGVFLIGGSSRIPLLGELLEAQGLTPLDHGDPSTAVATGAIRYAQGTLLAQTVPVVEVPPQPRPEPQRPPIVPPVVPPPGEEGDADVPVTPVVPWWKSAPAKAVMAVVALGVVVLVVASSIGGSSGGGTGLPAPSPTIRCSNGDMVAYAFECTTPGVSSPPAEVICWNGDPEPTEADCPADPTDQANWSPGAIATYAKFEDLLTATGYRCVEAETTVTNAVSYVLCTDGQTPAKAVQVFEWKTPADGLAFADSVGAQGGVTATEGTFEGDTEASYWEATGVADETGHRGMSVLSYINSPYSVLFQTAADDTSQDAVEAAATDSEDRFYAVTYPNFD